MNLRLNAQLVVVRAMRLSRISTQYRFFPTHGMRFIALLILIISALNGRSAELGKVKIDVQQSDDAIRHELLSYTPIGIDADKVLEFVHLRLFHEGGFASGVGIMPKPGISVALGHIDGFFAHRSIVVDWTFDENRKLQSIKITRFYQEGSYNPQSDPPSGDKVRIDLHQSDEAIRAALLSQTPLGTTDNIVLKFIQTRLYCQSAIASGQAVIGKPGIGVILGHYRDPHALRQTSVRVNWSFNEQRELLNIEIKRVKEDF